MLMKRRRRFIDGECNHIYQRTLNGFNIFYDREDYLVCYMIISTVRRKFKVKIIKMCLIIIAKTKCALNQNEMCQ